MKKVPIVALCGFLGSGKTTLLRRWRRDEALRDTALIIHDLSDLGVDAELLSEDDKSPEAGRLGGRVAALHGKHAGKELHQSLKATLNEVFKLKPPPSSVLAESTGAARPWPLIKALTQDNRYTLRHFIVTVDALNLHRDFEDGSLLVNESLSSRDSALWRAAEAITEQIAFASVIMLTKVDAIPKASVDTQVRFLKQLHPNTTIALSAQAGLMLSQLENVPSPDLLTLSKKAEQLNLIQQDSTAENVEATIFSDPRPFHPQRLHEACCNKLGTGLYRTKGFLWLASRPGHVLLWQQSGSQISLELSGLWRAEIAKNLDGKLLPEEVEQLNKRMEKEHPIFGDRHNELTIIGAEADRNGFQLALEGAICTEEEISAWKNGASFPDPWPKTMRHSN